MENEIYKFYCQLKCFYGQLTSILMFSIIMYCFSISVYTSEYFIILMCYYLCRGCFDVGEDDVNNTSPRDLDHDYGKIDNESSGPSSSPQQNAITQNKKFSSGPLQHDNFLHKKVVTDGDR